MEEVRKLPMFRGLGVNGIGTIVQHLPDLKIGTGFCSFFDQPFSDDAGLVHGSIMSHASAFPFAFFRGPGGMLFSHS